MHNLCYTLRERADLYHFTPCLIAWAQFSVVPYSVFEINSKRRVWIHLSGCLILSLGSSRGCLKAWRRRKIKYSTSMTNKIPFVPKCCTFILKNKRKYHTSFQAQHFKSKRFSSSQGLLQGLASKMFYCELQCEQSLENIEANEIGLNCKFSLPTSRLCAICSWCCRPFLSDCDLRCASFSLTFRMRVGKKAYCSVQVSSWSQAIVEAVKVNEKGFLLQQKGNGTEGCLHYGEKQGAPNKSSQFTAQSSLRPFSCSHKLWLVTKNKDIADTSSTSWASSTGWLASPTHVRKWTVQQTGRASGIELLCLCADRRYSWACSGCSALTTEHTQNTP